MVWKLKGIIDNNYLIGNKVYIIFLPLFFVISHFHTTAPCVNQIIIISFCFSGALLWLVVTCSLIKYITANLSSNIERQYIAHYWLQPSAINYETN